MKPRKKKPAKRLVKKPLPKIKKSGKMSAEWIFLHYAFPCLGSMQMRGKNILPKHVGELNSLISEKSTLISGETNPRRSLLRFVFYNAFRGVKTASQRLGCQVWDERAVREYFIKDHNAHVDKGKGKYPENILKVCRVRLGTLEKITKKGKAFIATVKFADGHKEQVNANYFPKAEKGRQVAIHFGTLVDNLR